MLSLASGNCAASRLRASARFVIALKDELCRARSNAATARQADACDPDAEQRERGRFGNYGGYAEIAARTHVTAGIVVRNAGRRDEEVASIRAGGQLKTKLADDGVNASTCQLMAGEQALCMRMPKVSAAPTVVAPHSGN